MIQSSSILTVKTVLRNLACDIKLRAIVICDKVKAWQDSRIKQKILSRQLSIELADKKEKAAIALVFNTRYVLADKFFKEETGRFDRPEDGVGLFGILARRGNAWMCPTCNRIHASIRMSTFAGLIYPACCQFGEGPRHDDLPAKASLKRPIGMFGHDGIYQQRLQAGIGR